MADENKKEDVVEAKEDNSKKQTTKKANSESKKQARSMAKNVNVKPRLANSKFRVRTIKNETKLYTAEELEKEHIWRLLTPACQNILNKGKSISERLKD